MSLVIAARTLTGICLCSDDRTVVNTYCLANFKTPSGGPPTAELALACHFETRQKIHRFNRFAIGTTGDDLIGQKVIERVKNEIGEADTTFSAVSQKVTEVAKELQRKFLHPNLQDKIRTEFILIDKEGMAKYTAMRDFAEDRDDDVDFIVSGYHAFGEWACNTLYERRSAECVAGLGAYIISQASRIDFSVGSTPDRFIHVSDANPFEWNQRDFSKNIFSKNNFDFDLNDALRASFYNGLKT